MFGTLYESDHTKWMREMMAKNPEWAADQKVGRAIWWDKKIDLNEQGRYQQAKEPNKSYPYDVNFEF
jgi:pyocin large subunit-like protein